LARNSEINWQGTLLPEGASIEQAIRQLNDAALQIFMVVNSAGQLVGTITDGDIRRALLRGLSVANSVDEIVMRQALVVPPERWPEAVVELMRTNRIHQLPVVDEQRRVIGLHLWDEFIGSFERAKLMVIMAVGLGTRLVPYTETCRKQLLQVAGKPIPEHIVERAKKGRVFTVRTGGALSRPHDKIHKERRKSLGGTH
jgi:CBS-domain-containing membrane protein